MEQVVSVLAPICATIGVTASLSWWLSGRFYKLEQKVLERLKEHEAHDDERFKEMNFRVYGIELRNAIKDKEVPPMFKPPNGNGF